MRGARPRRALLAGAACALLACAHAARGPRYRSLELRLVNETGGAAFPQWDGSGAMALEPDILFSGKDFASIEASHGGDDKRAPSLALHFTKEAADRFTQLTSRMSGRKLAVVVGSKVVTAPKILHPITTGLFEITGPSETDVREMYRLIVGGGRGGGSGMESSAQYFIDGREVAAAEFEARLKSLKEVEHTWFCAETSDGGITGYDGKDESGAVYEYRAESGQKAGKSSLAKKPSSSAP